MSNLWRLVNYLLYINYTLIGMISSHDQFPAHAIKRIILFPYTIECKGRSYSSYSKATRGPLTVLDICILETVKTEDQPTGNKNIPKDTEGLQQQYFSNR